MQLNIDSDRAARLARELARVTGESVSRAVTLAIEERLARERSKPRAERREIAANLQALGDEMSRLPVLDERPGDEILYDEVGLPKGREAE
jgi:antitoxin VapB